MNKKIIAMGLMLILFSTSVLPLSAIGINKSILPEKEDIFLKVSRIYFNWGEQSEAITLYDCWTEKPLITPEFDIKSGNNNPAAYVKGNKITIKIKFISDIMSNAQIKATGTFGGFPSTDVTFQNGETDWIYLTNNEFAPQEIKNQSVSWNWQFYNTTSSNWDDVDITSHTIFLLNKEPIVDHVWKKLADWTTNWCTGLSDDKDIADAILNGFVVDKYLKYDFPIRNNIAEVLRSGSGLCGNLASIFYSSCGTQGVKTIKFGFIIFPQIINLQFLWHYMIINDLGLGREKLTVDYEINGKVVNNTYPYPKYYGQGSENDDVDEYIYRAWNWFDHAVNLLEYNGVIYLYDLAYGKIYENVFESIPSDGRKSSSQVPLFRENYFDKAVDFLQGKVYYCDENGNKNKRDIFEINTSIIPDKVDGRNQIMFRFVRIKKSKDYTKIVSRTKIIHESLCQYILEKLPRVERLILFFSSFLKIF